jgi:6-pyruvoyltetrahydropterin/6-carboxytetrahydropterin synthase
MRVYKKFSFDASHILHGHKGKCKNLHGHTYFLEVGVEGKINGEGFVMDFHDIKDMVEEVVMSKYDHHHLNDFFERPTAEIMASQIFKDLSKWLLDHSISASIFIVRLWETPTCYAEVCYEDEEAR